MEILFTQRFKKRFVQLPPKIQTKFAERIRLFLSNPFHPQLQNHPLQGNLVGLRAFSVTGDYRVIFCFISQEQIKLIDIGRHGQVYR